MATPFLYRHQKNVLRSLLPFLKGNSLAEEMFLEYFLCVLRRFGGASIEKVSPLKLL